MKYLAALPMNDETIISLCSELTIAPDQEDKVARLLTTWQERFQVESLQACNAVRCVWHQAQPWLRHAVALANVTCQQTMAQLLRLIKPDPDLYILVLVNCDVVVEQPQRLYL